MGHMDVLPGDDPAMPDGCTAGYYVGPKRGSNGKPKWSPHPAPASKVCAQPHFVPMGCHKCWFWNYKTWKFMMTHCPVVKTMRALRKEYRIGIEFTDWPTRPKAKPIKGPILPDVGGSRSTLSRAPVWAAAATVRPGSSRRPLRGCITSSRACVQSTGELF